MKNTRNRKVVQVLKCAGLATALVALRPAWADTVFVDPLDAPALEYSDLGARPMLAVAAAGERLVAVGSRGLIIFSDDNGRSWSQAPVPVQSDLLSVHFPTAMKGWAVGHDGVILHTSDGGATWEKQLDGRAAEEQFKAFYTALGPDGEGPLYELKLNYRAGPALPFLDVLFENEKHGYAVGSFGMIASTDDGGASWEPWLHRIDNPQALHLNSLQKVGNDIYIAGERGQIFRLDRNSRQFSRIETGYRGSFFGIVGQESSLIAYGLRGTVYRSPGFESAGGWEPVSVPTEQTLVSAVMSPGGRQVYLLSTNGELIWLGDAASESVEVQHIENTRRATDIVVSESGQPVLSGLGGIRQISLKAASGDLSKTAAQ